MWMLLGILVVGALGGVGMAPTDGAWKDFPLWCQRCLRVATL